MTFKLILYLLFAGWLTSGIYKTIIPSDHREQRFYNNYTTEAYGYSFEGRR